MIFLGGGGDIEESKEIDSIFFKHFSNKDKILYIPIACNFTSYENCAKWFQSLFSAYNEKIEFEMLTEISQIPELSRYKGIYIGGGNTYKLLEYLCQTNLDEELKLYEKAGGIIYGGSAGAIILGKTIETVVEEKESYTDNQALDLLPPYAVRCHYIFQDDTFFSELSQQLNLPILALPENGGVIIENGTITPIGTVFCFEKGIKSIFKKN